MASTIHKFVLATESNTFAMPAGAKVLSIQVQQRVLALWAHIPDPDAPKVNRCFVAYGTGHKMPDDPGEYIATVLMAEGRLVLHFYEEIV